MRYQLTHDLCVTDYTFDEACRAARLFARIVTPQEIIAAAIESEAELIQKHISEAKRNGCRAIIRKVILADLIDEVVAERVELRRTHDDWYLVKIEKVDVYPDESSGIARTLVLTTNANRQYQRWRKNEDARRRTTTDLHIQMQELNKQYQGD